MPNPRLTVRIPPDVDSLLPDDGVERSRITIEALRAYLQPDDRENELRQMKQQIASLMNAVEAIRRQLQQA